LVAAVALLFGVFTSSLLATLLTFGVYLMGNLSTDLVTLGNLSRNSSIQTLTQGLYLVLPNLSLLNLKNKAVYNLLPSPLELLGNGVYGLVYTVMLLAIAILIFSRREF
jgi:ABC-type transport system involved in multi-copper enzyme maturation permease subunit